MLSVQHDQAAVNDHRDGRVALPDPAVHPPPRSGRAGPEGQEARQAGGPSLSSSTLAQTAVPAPGLVLTVQNRPCNSAAGGLAESLGLRFPTAAEVTGAADGLRDASRPSRLRAQIDVSPGVIRLRRTVPPADADDDSTPSKPSNGSGQIRAWTAKSRRQMVRSIAALDLAPMYESGRLPFMLTLTYPADWLAVAPDGEAVQRHLDMFERRWRRAWDEPLVMVWKREFQKRGAPHLHGFVAQPPGVAGARRRARHDKALAEWEASGRAGPRPRWRPAVGDGLRLTQWVSQVWADVVNHPDPDQRAAMVRVGTQVSFKESLRYADPKRLSIYFSKHGLYRDKEYQNQPPPEWDGKPVGRFWGVMGLSALTVGVQVDGCRDYYVIKRTLRRWSARTRVWDADAKRYRYVKAVKVRTKGKRKVKRRGEPAEVPRIVTRPVSRLAGASGSLCLNDAPAMARDLARLVALTVAQDQAGMRQRPSSLAGRMADEAFWCEHCGRAHPLREHRRCHRGMAVRAR